MVLLSECERGHGHVRDEHVGKALTLAFSSLPQFPSLESYTRRPANSGQLQGPSRLSIRCIFFFLHHSCRVLVT